MKDDCEVNISDTTAVASQNMPISQLTEQVSAIKMENKEIMDCFNKWAAQMEAFMTQNLHPTSICQAGGTKSSQAT